MNLDNKLLNFPHLYYTNLDNRVDRKKYMEDQFDRWGIKNYTRVSGTKYLASEMNKWIHLVDGDVYLHGNSPEVTANAMTHIEMIKNWLETTNDQCMVMMEDDVDLELIKYWHFDWNYLIKNIPYDWDCIQLGFESQTVVKFFLHPKLPYRTYFGPCMINRKYAEKLVNLHYDAGRFKFRHRVNNYQLLLEGGSATVDYFVCENGRTYCLPLLTVNNELGSYEDNRSHPISHHIRCREMVYDFWIHGRDQFTLEDFFIYGKPNDNAMTRKVFEDSDDSL